MFYRGFKTVILKLITNAVEIIPNNCHVGPTHRPNRLESKLHGSILAQPLLMSTRHQCSGDLRWRDITKQNYIFAGYKSSQIREFQVPREN